MAGIAPPSGFDSSSSQGFRVSLTAPWNTKWALWRKAAGGARMRGLRGWYRFRQLASSPGRRRKETNSTPSSGGTFRAARPGAVFGSWISGSTDSASERKPACPRRRIVASKGVERNDQEGRRGDQGNAQDAAAGAVREVAKAKRYEPADGGKAARVQPGRLKQQGANQQQRARPEESGGLADRALRAGSHERQGQNSGDRSRHPAPWSRPSTHVRPPAGPVA